MKLFTKILIALIVSTACLSNSASAQPNLMAPVASSSGFKSTNLSIASAPGLPSPPTPPVVLTPVRQTTGRMKIDRYKVSRAPNGSYVFSTDKVCQNDVNVDVYDARGLSSYQWTWTSAMTCESEINGVKVDVLANAGVILRDQELFDGEGSVEIRGNAVSLTSVERGTGIQRFHAGSSVMSRELDASAILTAEQGLAWDCSTGSCVPSADEEMFILTVEIGK